MGWNKTLLAVQEKKKKDQNEKENEDENKMVEKEEEEKDQPSSSTNINNKPRKIGNCITSLPDLGGQNMKLGNCNFSSHLYFENAILHNSFKIKFW